MSDVHARQEALAGYLILDTAPEPDFDDIVLIAQRVCETPTALVSLVDADRQWFKARVGFDACETPLDQSVCVHALTVSDIMVIPDLTLDPRTRDNTLVTGAPHIRFYAGAVLKTPEGVAIGSLCVIDGTPRPDGLTMVQADTLRALARQVMVNLALRKAMAEREEALVEAHTAGIVSLGRAEVSEAVSRRLRLEQARQIDAQRAGGVGTFEVDHASYRVRVSPETCRIFGLPVRHDYSVAEVQALIFDADRDRILTQESLADGTAPGGVDYRILRASDGALRWISRTAEYRTDEAGDVVALIGVVRDVTERKLVDLRAKALLDLGDALRDTTTTAEVVDLAARALGVTTNAARAAMSLIDLGAGTFQVERNWCAAGVASIAGTHTLNGFAVTVERLKTGATIVNANIPADLWLRGDAAAYEAIDVKAQVVVPMLDRGRLVAALFVHSTEPRTWQKGEIEFAIAVADRAYASIAKIRAEEHQHILNQELSHRLKNTFSMIQAITKQTLRGIAERDTVQALEDRIIALSKAHDVLVEQDFVSAPISGVIARAMAVHGHESRVTVAGPDVTFGPKATLSLSLLLHELATNAIKYGALSAENGRVSLAWRIDEEAEPSFSLTWEERGGPPAQAPTRKGFGSRLIGMGLVGAGNTRLDYGLQGLVAEFSAPMRTIAES